jgi:hypothetical protein
MSKKTFILSLGDKDKDFVELDDAINILSVRVAETFLKETQSDAVSLEFLSNLKKFIITNLIKDKDSLKYSVDVDFDTDLVE